MKKIKYLGILITSILFLSGCSAQKTNTETYTKTKIQKTDNAKVKTDFNAGEAWEVDGQWRLTVNSVSTTTDRKINIEEEENEDEPKNVIVVNYSYENLGYSSENEGLILSPEYIFDSSENVGKVYSLDDYVEPMAIPVGEKYDSVNIAYDVKQAKGQVKIYFETFDSNGKLQLATYHVEVN